MKNSIIKLNLEGISPTKFMLKRFKKTISLINRKSKTLLDIGCGNGSFIAELLRQKDLSFTKIHGLDLHTEALKKAKSANFPDFVSFEKKDVSKLSYDGSYDTVVALEIAEHLENMKEAIKHWYSLAKKELIVSVPYNETVRKIICTKCYQKTPISGHLQENLTEETFYNLFPNQKLQFRFIKERKWLSKKGNPNPFLRIFRSILLVLFFPRAKKKIMIVHIKK